MGDIYQLMQERRPERLETFTKGYRREDRGDGRLLPTDTGERTGEMGDFHRRIQERRPERLKILPTDTGERT